MDPMGNDIMTEFKSDIHAILGTLKNLLNFAGWPLVEKWGNEAIYMDVMGIHSLIPY